jgi:membrane fusion protein (multidrug efflux system)
VVVAPVETKDVDRSERFIGNIEAIQSVELKARVEGFLEEVAFEQGSMVEKGQVLYRIEQDQYKADLERRGPAGRGQGRPRTAPRRRWRTRGGLRAPVGADQEGRYLPDRLRPVQGRARRGQGRRREGQGQRAAGAGAVETPRSTSATPPSSPIAGRIGATAVTQGNLVDSNSGTLATVAQLDPIRAVFSIPSAELVRLQKRVGTRRPARRPAPPSCRR